MRTLWGQPCLFCGQLIESESIDHLDAALVDVGVSSGDETIYQTAHRACLDAAADDAAHYRDAFPKN
jgi:hypothetical protein